MVSEAVWCYFSLPLSRFPYHFFRLEQRPPLVPLVWIERQIPGTTVLFIHFVCLHNFMSYKNQQKQSLSYSRISFLLLFLLFENYSLKLFSLKINFQRKNYTSILWGFPLLSNQLHPYSFFLQMMGNIDYMKILVGHDLL